MKWPIALVCCLLFVTPPIHAQDGGFDPIEAGVWPLIGTGAWDYDTTGLTPYQWDTQTVGNPCQVPDPAPFGSVDSFHMSWWFHWQPMSPGTYRIDTCGTQSTSGDPLTPYDTKIAVWDPAFTSLFPYPANGPENPAALVACNDDSADADCPGLTSRVAFLVTSDQASYGLGLWIQLGGWSENDFGPAVLTITDLAPANNNCSGATPIFVGANPVGNVNATTSGVLASGLPPFIDVETPDTACQEYPGQDPAELHRDTWHSFTAPSSGTWLFTNCTEGTYDSKLAIYSGACGSLVALACNDDSLSCATSATMSDLRANLCAGQTYYLQVGGYLESLVGTATLVVTPDVLNVGVPYCAANPTSVSASGANLSANGTRCLGENDLFLFCDGVVDGEPGVFFYGTAQIFQPFGDGNRCVGGTVRRLWPPMQASGGQYVRHVNNVVAPSVGVLVPGSTHYFQCWFRDPAGGPAGFNLSDGIGLTFLP